MFLLDKELYKKVKAPLEKVKFNTLFARAVVEKHVKGIIYVDQRENPETFYIVHPYGMSLLFGSAGNKDFNEGLTDYLLNTNKIRDKAEWLQAYPDAWNKKLADLLEEKLVKYSQESDNDTADAVVENTRVNFKFNTGKYLDFKKHLGKCDFEIVRADRELFGKMKGSVVPMFFWDSADDFCKHGVGFCLVIGNQPVSTAYSAYITQSQLELGIETSEKFRGKGLALHACSVLIDYCLKYQFEPVWSCRLENTGSYRLARKLGFEPVLTFPYYRLP